MNRTSKISQTPLNRAKPHHRGTLFLEGVPKSTKAAFKSACAKQETTMRDAMIKLMRQYITDTENR